jgi:Ca2+-binding RTX toxin-like protein
VRRRRWRLAIAAIAATALAGSTAAHAAPPNCLYDQLPDHILFVGGDPEEGVALSVSGGEIVVTHILNGGGGQPVTCTGTPTTANTDTISVTLNTGGEATRLQISNPPAFAPGFTAEQFGDDEIEINADLGDAIGDRLVLVVAEANLVLGDTGVDWNPNQFFLDQDIALSGIEFHGIEAGVGETTFTGQGNSVTGGPIDRQISYSGGAGRDRVTGGEGLDGLDGGAGRDVMHGAGGIDYVTGGPGARDKLFGDNGADKLFAKDGKRDRRLDCGPGGGETVKRDKRKDPDPISC